MSQADPIAAFRALRLPAGQRLLNRLDQIGGAAVAADPLRVATEARRSLADSADLLAVPAADLVSAALTQVRLRSRAREKFGPAAEHLYFTPAGLEQATRASVARYRAGRFAAAALGADTSRPVADLCCGVGADLIALAQQGMAVEGVDADPFTAAVATANVEALDLSDRARVRCADVTELASVPGKRLRGYAAVFCDPSRRGKRGRIFNPHAYSPPWDTVVALGRGAPAACVKTAPGIPHEMIPGEAGAEWISVGGDVKEAALWFGDLRGAARRATLLPPDSGEAGYGSTAEPATLVAEPGIGAPLVAPVGGYLYEPDGAVIRAGLVAEAAALVSGALLDPKIAYVTSDRLVATPFCRVYAVAEVLPFSVKRLRSALRQREVGNVTIKKRGSAVDVEKLRGDLRLRGPNSAVVVLTRIGNRPLSVLCDEVRASAMPFPTNHSSHP